MIPIKKIISNTEDIITRLKNKGVDANSTIKKIVSLYKEQKFLQTEADNLKSELNKISKEIAVFFKQKEIDLANKAKQKTAEIKAKIKKIDDNYNKISNSLKEKIVSLPNVPHESVPIGSSEADNEIIKDNTKKITEFDFKALPHWDLIKKYDIIDLELGAKITGSGFPVFKGKGAKLQRALVQFFLDEAENNGYLEYIPPLLVNTDSAYATGQLPDKEGQMYHCKEDELYLIPTAEVPLTNIYRNKTVKAEDLPIKITAHSQCFRREAGSYGKDVKGLNRVHQFEKVEIVRISDEENSYKQLDEMVKEVENILQKLELPYRILRLCSADISFTSALTYDFEVYSAAQKRWLEVSSVSNFEDFQTNRLKLKYKDEETKKTKLAHSLNGSALALPRIMAAIIENNQTKNTIKIPEVLRKYTGFDEISS